MLNSTRRNFDKRRFLYELDSIISNANEGRFRPTYRLLQFFRFEVSEENIPTPKHIEFVSKTMDRTLSSETRRGENRNIEIIKAIQKELLKGKTLTETQKNLGSAVSVVAEEFSLTQERIISIYFNRASASPIVLLCRVIAEGKPPDLDLLENVSDEMQKTVEDLLADNDKGERLRTRLNLRGFKEWKKPTAEHEEITQDIQVMVNTGITRTKAREKVAKHSKVGDNIGYSVENTKKIDQRKRHKIKQDIEDLIDAGVSPDNAIAMMARVSGLPADELK